MKTQQSTIDEAHLHSAIAVLEKCLHPHRLALLHQLLYEGPQDLTQLAGNLNLSIKCVQRHLTILQEAKLVRQLVTGNWMAEVQKIKHIQTLLGYFSET